MKTFTRKAYWTGKKKFLYADQVSNKREFGELAVGGSYTAFGQAIVAGERQNVVVPVLSSTIEDLSTIQITYLNSEYIDENDNYKIGINYDEPPKAEAEEGGYCIQSKHGTQLNVGSITELRSTNSYVRVYGEHEHISEKALSKLFATEHGFQISGIVRRDIREEDLGSDDTVLLEHMSAPLNDFYREIGRSPEKAVIRRFNEIQGLAGSLLRNPPLVENIDVTYEYPHSYNIGNESDEYNKLKAGIRKKEAPTTREDYEKEIREINQSFLNEEDLDNNDPKLREKKIRKNLRYNVFNFSDNNKLVEKIIGTSVDLYGNVLDINRRKIAIEDFDNPENIAEDAIRKINRKHRKGIGFHFEINARKELEEKDINAFKHKDKSKWFVDIDKEGLTKVNIPSTSGFGNIPILTRHKSNELFKEDVDITIDELQIGIVDTSTYEEPGGIGSFEGITVMDGDGNKLGLENVIYNFPYHNVITTASRILANTYDTTRDPPTSFDKTTAITNTINAGQQGGRSLSTNFDGLWEVSLGADTIDKKSFILDTAGAIIHRIGRDKHGRSIMTQTDGDVLLQIGGLGKTDSDDKRFKDIDGIDSFRAGAFTLQVVTSDGHSTRSRIAPTTNKAPSKISNDQVIRVTDEGVEFFITGNLTFDVTNNIEICGRNVNIRGATIGMQPGHVLQGKGKPLKRVVPNNVPVINAPDV